jgi:glutathione S-transferase
MLRIWGRTNSGNVQKVMWAVGELGVPHERIDAGAEHGRLDTEAYGAMNPNRRVPTIDDDGFVLWESNVIVRYLAARYGAGTLCPADARARAVADQWMDWQQTTLGPELRVVFWGLVRTAPEKRDPKRIAAGIEGLKALWTLVDRQLRDRPFLAGDAFTMGDVPVGVMCWRYHELAIARPDLPHVAAWYERLRARAAYREHVMQPLS